VLVTALLVLVFRKRFGDPDRICIYSILPSFVAPCLLAATPPFHCVATHSAFLLLDIVVCSFVCTRLSCHRAVIRSLEVLEPPSTCDCRHCTHQALFCLVRRFPEGSPFKQQKSFVAFAKSSFVLAESLDSLQLTAVDKALLQQTAAHKRVSKSASFRIALLGGAAEANKVSPELVASRNAAGRALRSLYEAQGFKKRRSTKEQRIARQQREVDRARKVFHEALDARATSNQDRHFNSIVDTLPAVAPVNAPPPNTAQWRNRDGVLRDRSGSAARRQARSRHQRRINTAPQLPAPPAPPATQAEPAAPAADAPAAGPAPPENLGASTSAPVDEEIDYSEEEE
jgi:hypothetical protein